VKVRIKVICGDDLWKGETGVVYMSVPEALGGTRIEHVYKSGDATVVTLNQAPTALSMDEEACLWIGRMSRINSKEYKVVWPGLFTNQDIENIRSVRAWVMSVSGKKCDQKGGK